MFWKNRIEPLGIVWIISKVGKLLLFYESFGCCVGGGGNVLGSIFWLDYLGASCRVCYF
jgi:hypothetical protein